MFFTKLANQSCWICGATGNLSGEHKIKKTDLNKHPKVSPGIWRGYDGQEKPIQGLNSKLLKFENSICTTCNNQTTQQADLCYDKFRNNAAETIKNALDDNLDGFELSKTSSLDNTTRIELARYFGKHIGCQINHNKFPIPRRLSSFVGGRTNKLCISVNVRTAPIVWKDEPTGEIGPINGIGGIVLIHTHKFVFWPFCYQTAYMTDGMQFIITMKLSNLEALDIWFFHRRKLEKFRKHLSDDQSMHLGFSNDN